MTRFITVTNLEALHLPSLTLRKHTFLPCSLAPQVQVLECFRNMHLCLNADFSPNARISGTLAGICLNTKFGIYACKRRV